MAANVESMFYTRTKPWHGLGVQVQEAPESKDALRLAGLDWKVYQREVYTDSGIRIDGYRANVRNTDNRVLGVVTERYKIVQNEEAFAFTDALLGKGVRYETAGSLQDGRKVWLLARLPKEYIISGEQISPYLVFSNSHDGSAAVRVAVTPIRVVCNNTLNLALSTAKRSWAMVHTGNIKGKIHEAQESYMAEKIVMKNGQLQVSDRPIIPFIEGDGVGHDIWKNAQAIFDKAVEVAYEGKRHIEWQELLAGKKAYDKTGEWLPKETLEAIRESLVAIKGPLETPVGGGIRSLNVALRQELDLYACVRPVRYFDGVASPLKEPEKTNITIFRENTEDIYAGIEWEAGTADVKRVIEFLQTEMNVNKIRFPESSSIGIHKPLLYICNKNNNI